ncbi:MAG: Flp family type IVb pilin [Bacillota bacterium]|nr:Flp family type IVb pilin [Bacillota bacterium]MDW7677010.1 Flp family type IVb pilin [Bacillota bacterium]
MMEKMMRLVKDESGQGMAEYGLILALVAVVVIVALTALGGGVRDKMQEAADGLTPAAQ